MLKENIGGSMRMYNLIYIKENAWAKLVGEMINTQIQILTW